MTSFGRAPHNWIVIDDIVRRIEAYACHEEDCGENMRAAVLMPLYERDGDLHVVLMKRTDKVAHHRGEISFPGGGVDDTDADLIFTALREAREEIGLASEHVRIIGKLDDEVTRTGFHISAIVGVIDPASSPYTWSLQPSEVAEVLEVPLAHLLDKANVIEVPRSANGSIVLSEGFQFREHTIWGATARILRNFLSVVYESESLVVEPRR
jgi:8-oxo-dGTP pyrophosphatase MutT (NUDIX family)